MKTFALTLGALATLVAAQDVSDLPECGQFCAEDMLNGQAQGIGCEANDLSCLCQTPEFTWGLRDCSAATCDSDSAREIVEFGVSLCREAGVIITTGVEGEPTASTTSPATDAEESSTLTSTILETVTTPVDTTTISPSASVSTPGGDDEDLTSTITRTNSEGETTTFVTTYASTASDGSPTGDGSDGDDDDDDSAALALRAPAAIMAVGIAAMLL